MTLRLPLFLVAALFGSFSSSSMAAPYEVSADGILETSVLGAEVYTTVLPSANASWNLPAFELHIGR